jgi:hypothetical protein
MYFADSLPQDPVLPKGALPPQGIRRAKALPVGYFRAENAQKTASLARCFQDLCATASYVERLPVASAAGKTQPRRVRHRGHSIP